MGKVFDQPGWESGNLHTDGTTPADQGANQLPNADFSVASSGLTQTFTDLSTDPDGSIVAWRWTFGDGSAATTSPGPVGHTYGLPGTYTVSLTVTDDAGGQDTATRNVTVSAGGGGNQPPVANFTVVINSSTLTATVTNSSTDDVGITSYLWGWGDGTTSTGASPAPHVYPRAGVYTISLTVTDGGGLTDVLNRSRTVGNPPAAYSFRSMIALYGADITAWGAGGLWPDATFQTASLATSSASNVLNATTGYIDKARAAGGGLVPAACLIMKVTPGNGNLQDTAGNFDLFNKWVPYVDAFIDTAKSTTYGGVNGEVKLQSAVRDGVIRFLYLLDDFAATGGANGFNRLVTYEEVEYMAYYVKVVKGWTWMPTTGRTPSSVFRSRAAGAAMVSSHPYYSRLHFLSGDSTRINGVRQYQYIDASWNQMRIDRDGPNIDTYVTSQWNAAKDCNVAVIGGGNMLSGGDATQVNGVFVHGDAAWRVRQAGETDAQYFFRMHPNCPPPPHIPTSTELRLFGMSPTEIKLLVQKMLNRAETTCQNLWTSSSTITGGAEYVALSDIGAALTAALAYSVDRIDGPQSVGNKLTILT